MKKLVASQANDVLFVQSIGNGYYSEGKGVVISEHSDTKVAFNIIDDSEISNLSFLVANVRSVSEWQINLHDSSNRLMHTMQ
jgi:hypothetical protein